MSRPTFVHRDSPLAMPIAICGMGMRLPGGIRTDKDLFDFLVQKKDARTKVPMSRYNVDAFYDEHGKLGSIKAQHGYFLDDVDFTKFDVSMFTTTEAEASRLDPSQRLVLEVVREAFETAGEGDFRGKNIGTYTSLFSEDWKELQDRDPNDDSPYQLTGRLDFMLANRLAYEYDLRGASMTIKTACSSSGVALHQALQSIRLGESSAAIVAGANLILTPGFSVTLSGSNALSPDGSSKTFDASADGYARAEAVSCIYIKRLDEAIRDGNPIRAVIRASGSNADGRSHGGLSVPSSAAQEALIRQTYQGAGLDFADTAMFECHGTGTAIGDPLEVSAVANCFGGYGMYIGSVKPNLGHSEGAAAITSIIKAVVSLENRTIIPNIKLITPNPQIPWETANLQVPIVPLTWPNDRYERISVNSFGLGGSNAHFVLDSAKSFGLENDHGDPEQTTQESVGKQGQRLLLLSANSQESLHALTKSYREYLAKHPDRLDSLAYTLAKRREPLKIKGACIAGPQPTDFHTFSTRFQTKERKSDSPAKVAFVFTGQGAQWVHMGRDLIQSFPLFRESLRSIDKILGSLKDGLAPTWTVEGILMGCYDKTVLSKPEISQPICTALQLALVDLLAAWDVKPAAVVGHSSGEIGAAYAAGCLTREEAILVAFYRGHVCQSVKPKGCEDGQHHLRGAMAAIGLGREEVQRYLNEANSNYDTTTGRVLGERDNNKTVELPSSTTGKVVIACENSKQSVTISGEAQQVEACMKAVQRDSPDALVRKLQVEMAYHSHHMFPVGSIYHSIIHPYIHAKASNVPFISSVHPDGAETLKPGDLGPKYWQENLERPVLFRSAVTRLLQEHDDITTHLEIGPHSALSGPLRQIYAENRVSGVSYISTLSRGENDARSFLEAMGGLYTTGVVIFDPAFKDGLNAKFQVLHDLPTYPWHYNKTLWAQSRVMTNWRYCRYKAHDLLGRRVLETSDIEPSWRNILRLVDVPWLQDHTVGNDIVLPAAAYVVMAGEAVNQLLRDGINNGVDYTVRDVHFTTAMLLKDDKHTEVITTLRPHMLTAKHDSEWFEFTVVSYDGSGWTRHCRGLVTTGLMPSTKAALTSKTTRTYTRKISSRSWYKAMRRIGLTYGPRFMGLEQITACVTAKAASAFVTDRQEESESKYALHPTTLDVIFQSSTVAQAKGVQRSLDTLFLPTFIKELYIGNNASSGDIHFDTQGDIDGTSSFGVPAGENNNAPAFFLDSLKGTPLSNGDYSRGDGSSSNGGTSTEFQAQRLHWHPDVDFVDAGSLMKACYGNITPELALLERLYIICAIELHDQIRDVTPCPSSPHFTKYKSWLADQVVLFSQPDYPMVPDSANLLNEVSSTRQKMIASLFAQLITSPVRPVAEAIHRTYLNLPSIISGATDFLNLLHHDGLLQRIYDWMNDGQDISGFVSLLGNCQPNIKILEIGAGTGGFTAKVLAALKSPPPYDSERLYSHYTFTDISSGFFVQGKERFKDHAHSMTFKTLDISQDPTAQGFEAHAYDLVVASNVLHATPVLVNTLRNCRKLLKPNGRLFVQELHPQTKDINFLFGLFAGWWMGGEENGDGRMDQPYVAPKVWDDKLKETGFEGIESIMLDGEPPFHMNANIVARPMVEMTSAVNQEVTILLAKGNDRLGPLGGATKIELERLGYDVDQAVFGSAGITSRRDVISFVDLEGSDKPLLQDMGGDDLYGLQQIVNGLSLKNRLLWLTKLAQMDCGDPHDAQMLGFARTVRAELSTDFATLEIEDINEDHVGRGLDAAAAAIAGVFHKLHRARMPEYVHPNAQLNPDMEYVWKSGAVHLGRFHWFPVGRALTETVPPPVAKKLVVGQPGVLQSLQWRGLDFTGPPAPDQVRIRTCTIGLNFHGLMSALGLPGSNKGVDHSGGIDAIGAEGVGYVTALGTAVGLGGEKYLEVGDRVLFTGWTYPGFATEIERPAICCKKAPDNLSDEDGATMPVDYFAAMSCLLLKAKLEKGQTLLIHSAAGGVGIAAIHLARWIGADIYVTTGSKENVEFLAEKLKVPRDRIFDSHDNGFVGHIMNATNGAGVDCVLNSLSGELLHASWNCVAESGCMVDIKDAIGHGQLDMVPIAANRTFTCVDLSTAMKDMGKTEKAFTLMNILYAQGHVHPIHPIKVFEADKVEDAYRYMQQGTHMGKVVVKFPEDASTSDSLPLVPTTPEPSFKSNVSYLLVGGTGGLGKTVASWMASYGARHFIFLSRSAGKHKDDNTLFQELEESGCSVQCFAGDVADPDLVRTIVTQGNRPIAGVMQMAMVLRDVGVKDMDIDTWMPAIRPKVDGTWNLHRLLPKDLDFFVLFGSMGGIFGYFGQANYASANTFLDAFVQYRQAQGQAASVIDLGPIDDVGHVAQTAETFSSVSTRAGIVKERDFLSALHLATMPVSAPRQEPATMDGKYSYHSPCQFSLLPRSPLPMTDPKNMTIWKRDPRMAIYRNIEDTNSTKTGSGEASDVVRAFVASLSTDPGKLNDSASAELLVRAIGARVAMFMMRADGLEDAELSRNPAELGVDSLVALEIRNWWKQSLGVEVSVIELLSGRNIHHLGELAVDRLKGKYGGRMEG